MDEETVEETPEEARIRESLRGFPVVRVVVSSCFGWPDCLFCAAPLGRVLTVEFTWFALDTIACDTCLPPRVQRLFDDFAASWDGGRPKEAAFEVRRVKGERFCISPERWLTLRELDPFPAPEPKRSVIGSMADTFISVDDDLFSTGAEWDVEGCE